MLRNFIPDDQITVKVNILSGNDLVSNRRQTKITTDRDSVHRRILESAGLNELNIEMIWV